MSTSDLDKLRADPIAHNSVNQVAVEPITEAEFEARAARSTVNHRPKAITKGEA